MTWKIASGTSGSSSNGLDFTLHGGVADGTTDNTAAFASVASAVASDPSGVLYLPKGTYRLASNQTIAYPIFFAEGAMISVDSTKTVILTGNIIASEYQKIFSVPADGYVLPQASEFANVCWFGADATGTTPTHLAFQNALNSTLITGGLLRRHIFLPPGTYKTDKPIVVNTPATEIEGAGKYSTSIQTSGYAGPTIFMGSSLPFPYNPNDISAGLGSVTLTDNAANYINLRRYGQPWDLNGKSQFSMDILVRVPSPQTASRFIISSSGSDYDGVYASAFELVTEDSAFGFSDVNMGLRFHLTTSVTGIVDMRTPAGVLVPGNSFRHIRCDYDGAHMRMFLDGYVIVSQAVTGTIVQQPFEAVALGLGFTTGPDAAGSANAPPTGMRVASLREGWVSRGSSNFTPPIGKYVEDGSTKFLMNFDISDGPFQFGRVYCGASVGMLDAWLPNEGLPPSQIPSNKLSKMTLYAVAGPALFAESIPNIQVKEVLARAQSGIHFGSNCYVSNIEDCECYDNGVGYGIGFHLGAASNHVDLKNLQSTGFTISLFTEAEFSLSGWNYFANPSWISAFLYYVFNAQIGGKTFFSDEGSVVGGLTPFACASMIGCGNISWNNVLFGFNEQPLARQVIISNGGGAPITAGPGSKINFNDCSFVSTGIECVYILHLTVDDTVTFNNPDYGITALIKKESTVLGRIIISPTQAITTVNIVTGDVVCPADLTDNTKITKSTRTARSSSISSIGVAINSALAGKSVQFARAGENVPASLLSLGSGVSTWVAVNDAGTLVRKVSLSGGESIIGTCDSIGNLAVNPFNVPGSKYVVNVKNYGVRGSSHDNEFENSGINDPDSQIHIALADALAAGAAGYTSELHFPAAAPDAYVATYWLRSPLRVAIDNFKISGGGRLTTRLRNLFFGPSVIAGFMNPPPVVATIVPPFAGEPAGQAWDADGNISALPRLNLRESGLGQVNGFSKMTQEFFIKLDGDITGGTSWGIGGSGGTEFAGATYDTAWLIGIRGVGVDRQIHCTMTTSVTGLINLNSTVPLVIGNTYHVALDYDGYFARLIVSDITNPTGGAFDVESMACTGTIVQKIWEGVTLGSVPGNILGTADDILHGYGPFTFTGWRSSDVSRYGGGAFVTPITKWNPAFDIHTKFILNFDQILYGDVVKAYGPGNHGGRNVIAWIPTMASGFPGAINNFCLEDIGADGGLTDDAGKLCGGGFLASMAVGCRISRIDANGWYVLYLNNNCFNSMIDDVSGTGAGQWAVADIGAGNSNAYSNLTTGGGEFANLVLIGGNPVNITGATYLTHWGEGYAIYTSQSLVALYGVTCSAEARTLPDRGSLACGGLGSKILAEGCVFDATWVTDFTGIPHSVPPITIFGGGLSNKFDNCFLTVLDDSPEVIQVRGIPVEPTIVEGCLVSPSVIVPISLSPELVLLRSYSIYEQNGGYNKWVDKSTDFIHEIIDDIGNLRTTNVTPRKFIFAKTNTAKIVLNDNARTKFEANVFATGSNWTWDTDLKKSFDSLDGYVTSSSGTSSAPDSVGSPPIGITASIVETNPPLAPTATLVASAGLVTDGYHQYCYTFVDPDGEQASGILSNAVNTITANHGQVNLTVIATGPTGTTARKIYRTKANAPTAWFLLHTISDNTTTTYTDNIADASLTTRGPLGGATLGVLFTGATYSVNAAVSTKQTIIRGAASYAYSPLNLGSKLVFWLDPTVTTLISGNVDVWTDRSGNGYNFDARATSGNRPAYTSSGISGSPSLILNGSNVLELIAAKEPFTQLTTSGEIFAVLQTTAGGIQAIWNFGTGSGGYYNFGGDTYENFGSTTRNNATSGITLTNPHIYSAKVLAGVQTVSFDSSAPFMTNSVTPGFTTNIPLFSNGFGAFFTGMSGDIILTDGTLTVGEKADLITYLKSKYPTLP